LELLNNLLKTRVMKNSILFKEFKFSEDEVKVLKYIMSSYIKDDGVKEIDDILASVFNAKTLQNRMQYIPVLLELKNKGYIDTGSFIFDALNISPKIRITNSVTKLEMLNNAITVSQKFLHLLENGLKYKNLEKADKKPYNHYFEYIEDMFQKIQILLDFQTNKYLATQNIKYLENVISQRLEISTLDFPLADLLKEYKFSQKEELVLLSVLSEEYSYFPMLNLRAIDNLIMLISADGVEKFEARAMFKENSKLVQDKIFEFETTVNVVGENKTFTVEELYISEEILNKIEPTSKSKSKDNKSAKLKELVEKQDIFELIQPKQDLDSVVLPAKTKDILNTIVKQLDTKVINRLIKWGIRDEGKGISARIIFHGSAGTGKTMSAIALAKTLKKDILHFDCSKVLSMYVGESEKNVRNIFDTYKELVKNSGLEPILFLNEADQFLSSRSTDTGSSISQMYNQMQNIFLEQIENFEGILVATTNMLDNLDKAFSRRFNYKVEFKPPLKAERVEIWQKHIPKNATFEKDFSVEPLAEFKLTGGQIDLIVKNTAFKVATQSRPIFKISDFLTEIEFEKNTNFENDKVMGFLGNN